jgi:hypothetical protein
MTSGYWCHPVLMFELKMGERLYLLVFRYWDCFSVNIRMYIAIIHQGLAVRLGQSRRTLLQPRKF